MADEANTEEVVAPPTEDTAPPAPVGLNLEDLKVVCGAIEIGANRGAYRPNEFKVIGEVWERVTAFIKATEPMVAKANGEAPQADGVNVEPVNAEPVVTEDSATQG
jgi:hypothetical protein